LFHLSSSHNYESLFDIHQGKAGYSQNNKDGGDNDEGDSKSTQVVAA
jgi:hypothetical protein